MFDTKTNLIFSYRLTDTSKVCVYTEESGATTKDFTDIIEIQPHKDTLLKRIDGSYSGYKIEINHLNHDSYRIVFTDDSVFKGMKKSFFFNLSK